MDTQQRKELYQSLFLNSPNGDKVLEDLMGIFYDKNIFVKGGVEGDRQTTFNLGSREVLSFILRNLNQTIEVTLDGSNDPTN
tara:strand:+ start:4458 stop:4703 length:246 start_codon:yes stop_codon:yes gene_type:complete